MSYATTNGRRFVAMALVTLLVMALVGTTGVPKANAVEQSSIINFESGFTAGDVPSTLTVGQGMTGANLGTVSVSGTNPAIPGNAAMIFDATCGGQTVPVTDPGFDPDMCSGGDWDLYQPLQGNTLIITEDGDSSDPDDTANASAFWTFDFTSWGPGEVTVEQLVLADIDLGQTGGTITVLDSTDTVLGVFPIPELGDNTKETVVVNTAAVVRMVVGPMGSGQIDDIQISADSPIIDLELTKDVAPSLVEVGDEATFTISVVNQGPDDATGVVVTDTLPAGLTYVSDNAAGAYDSATGVWTIGALAVEESVSMEFVVTVDEAGTFVNEAEVTAANEPDSDSTPGDGEGDDWDDATVTGVVPPAIIDLELVKDVSPAAVQVGGETTFSITVVNQGPDDATGVVVTDTLPAGLTYLSDDGAGAYDSATGVWTIGNLTVGASVQLSFDVTVDAEGTFTNVAEVTAANEEDSDSTPGDGEGDDWDDAVVVATVTPPPIIDLELEKTVDERIVLVGGEATFTITVVNQGPDDATGVVVTDTLPVELTYVSDTGGDAYDGATGIWTIGDLAVGASTSIDLVATVDAPGVFTNVAEVTAANEEDSDSTPNNGVETEDDWDSAVVESAEPEASSSIGDYVWYDLDNDRVQDSNEGPVAGVTVRLTNQATNEVLTQVTNSDGRYLFGGLDAGTYVVEVLTSTFPDNHGLTTVGTYTVTVLDDQSFLDADFGIIPELPNTGMEVETAALIGMLFLAIGGSLLGFENSRRRMTDGAVIAA